MGTRPNCPKCKAIMIEKKGKWGNFWGCTRFPTCKGTRQMEKQVSTPIVKSHPIADFLPSTKQTAIFDWVKSAVIRVEKYKNQVLSLVIKATAGSGKTTTAVKLLAYLPQTWQVIVIAFNTAIKNELANRVPEGISVSTYHGLGFAPLRAINPKIQVKNDKTDTLLNVYFGVAQMAKEEAGFFFAIYGAIKRLVSLSKNMLISSPTPEQLEEMILDYEIEIEQNQKLTAFQAVQYILNYDINLYTKGIVPEQIDFDDMLYLPIVLNLPLKKYNALIVDELQDTNLAQLELAFRSIATYGLFIGVGDEHQAIYGFRGADSEAISRVINRFNASVLPLDITYRNSLAVVRMVNELFPSISHIPSDNAPEGNNFSVALEKLAEYVKPGDMVLSRTNAPLVKPAFDLIKEGYKVVIRGRDIGEQLVSLIGRMKASSIVELAANLAEYHEKETEKLTAANRSTAALDDRVETVYALMDNVKTIKELINKIDSIFSDDIAAITFSSIHKAKGLESENVFVFTHALPHPKATSERDIQQEKNLYFVAITRAKINLTMVMGKPKGKSKKDNIDSRENAESIEALAQMGML